MKSISTRQLVALMLGLICLILAVFWMLSVPDPRYNGKRLSAYLYDLQPTRTSPRTPTILTILGPSISEQLSARREAQRAIREIGPKAIPLLGYYLRSSSSLRDNLRHLASAHPSSFRWLQTSRWLNFEPRAIAYEAIMTLVPERSAPLIPIIRQQLLTGDPESSEKAARLMVRIFDSLPPDECRRLAGQNADYGENLTAAPVNHLTKPTAEILGLFVRPRPFPDRERIMRRLWPYRKVPFNYVRYAIAQIDRDGFFQNMITLESGSEGERPDAALYFSYTPSAPQRIVPLLMSNLVESKSISVLQDSCAALAAYRTNALPALPPLTNLLFSSFPGVVNAASNAIARITLFPKDEIRSPASMPGL